MAGAAYQYGSLDLGVSDVDGWDGAVPQSVNDDPCAAGVDCGAVGEAAGVDAVGSP